MTSQGYKGYFLLESSQKSLKTPCRRWRRNMTLLNQLATSTSPYLLQHASNPIQWYPWGEEALTKAQQEDKPILLSIGYAACHWCHVMAHESFEDKEIATIMNAHFINIKVDREENPAIDQIAIEAVQRMGLQAGWPLHVFLTPNQQPFYGGTYFPPKVWKQLLTDIASAFKNHREEILKSSSYFTESLHTNELKNALVLATDVSFTAEISQQIFQKIYQQLDHHQGGTPGSPKFFMPSIHAFLLDYYRLTQEQKALHQLNLTLTHIACGGIYDHLGGGFYRYSTDETWIIPHFEKMLYDNAQLLSLYAHAYTITKNPFYKQTIEHTIGFIEREMLNQSGGFHSSLDADSEEIEGAFYTWTYAEIEKLLEEDMVIFSDYYNITKTGNWHNGLNILYRNPQSLPDILDKHQADIEEKLARAKQIVYTSRYTTRPKPALNDQVIASWNGMMLQALVNIYYALGDEHFLELALKNATYIREYFIQRAQMWHSHSQGKQGRTGYLEDYAWVAKAFISLYEATLQEDWLYQAEQLVQYVFKHFNNSENDLFYFTDIKEPVLIKRTQEIFDQVTPSSNAVIAHALYLLGRLLNQEVYIKTSEKMLFRIYELLQQQPLYMAHWASLYLLQLHPPLLVTITGPDSIRWGQTIKQHHPEILVAGKLHNTTSSMLILPSTQEEKAAVYICSTRACHATLYSLDEALLWLKDWMLNQRA